MCDQYYIRTAVVNVGRVNSPKYTRTRYALSSVHIQCGHCKIGMCIVVLLLVSRLFDNAFIGIPARLAQ